MLIYSGILRNIAVSKQSVARKVACHQGYEKLYRELDNGSIDSIFMGGISRTAVAYLDIISIIAR